MCKEDILLNHRIPITKISHSKWVHKHIGSERRYLCSLRMLGACNDDLRSHSNSRIVVWLNYATACGLVPQKMIQLILRMCHVPKEIQAMLQDLFSGWDSPQIATPQTWSTWNLELSWVCTIFIFHCFGCHLESSRRKGSPAKSRWFTATCPLWKHS